MKSKNPAAAMPLFQRAIRLDPNFTMAYALLGISYSNVGENSHAAENMWKAFELRDHVSEYEKLFIESGYYAATTGDLEMAKQSQELWSQTYPRDAVARNNLSVTYSLLGQYGKALAEIREALHLDAENGLIIANVVYACWSQSRSSASSTVRPNGLIAF